MKKNSKFLIFNTILLIGTFFSAFLLSPFKDERAYANQTEKIPLNLKRSKQNKNDIVISLDIEDKETSLTKHQKEEDKQYSKRLWCNEHGVYEDECLICHPELGSDISSDLSTDLQCGEHRVPESECGICHPELSNSLNFGQGLKIRLESPESAVKAGIITNVLSKGESIPKFTVLSRVIYNQNRFAHITSLVSGIVQKVLVDVGAFVPEGEVLVEIASPDVAKIKAEYLTALTNEKLKKLVFERVKRLFNKKVASQYEYQKARAEYEIAKNNTNTTHQQLLNFVLAEDEIQDIEETQTSTSILPIRASFSGTIIDRHAVVGEFVKPGVVIFSLVDLSTMWLELSIPENILLFFKVGDKIEASFKEYSIKKSQGSITWLASNIDEESRMLKGRAVVKNPDAFLKHGMFGKVQLLSQNYSKKFNVPVKSVQRLDGRDFVFIKLSVDLFEARRVETGESDKENVEILQGLSPLDELVVDGSFTLKSEFLKSRFGEGCAD